MTNEKKPVASLRCTCPTKFDDRSRAVERANTDQLCPVHGRVDPSGKCKACGAPIMQVKV